MCPVHDNNDTVRGSRKKIILLAIHTNTHNSCRDNGGVTLASEIAIWAVFSMTLYIYLYTFLGHSNRRERSYNGFVCAENGRISKP